MNKNKKTSPYQKKEFEKKQKQQQHKNLLAYLNT